MKTYNHAINTNTIWLSICLS